MPTEDNHLWDRLRQGNKSALKSIYDQESAYLFNYGKKISRDASLVEDCIHDLFVEIWNKHNSLGATDSIRKYLAASLRRKIIYETKKLQKSQSTESFDDVHFEAELSIDQILINKEVSEEQALRLKNAFDQLSARQKEIIYLRFYKGLEYDQIAEVVGIQYQSLRNTISSAIKSLRDILGFLIVLALALKTQSNL